MSDDKKKSSDEKTMTRHGEWTPETSEAAAREVERLANENPFDTEAATEGTDKTHLNPPREKLEENH